VRTYRLAAHLSQEALAERAGITVRSVRNVERGRVRSPHPDTVRGLGTALGLRGAALEDFLAQARCPYWSARGGEESLISRPLSGQGRICLLGPVRLVATAQDASGGGVDTFLAGESITDIEARGVLAALALRITTVVPRDQLVDELWGEHPPSAVLERLTAHLASIEEALSLVDASFRIERLPQGIRLLGRRQQVDWFLFEELLAQGRPLARGSDFRTARSLMR
jgi:transcriptional regulator with XRE-family HTH domain